MFPDPETFNPLRWVKPEYPTYKEPLTEYPTIINSTQFGYGRRLCQGQTVADEDLLIGLGSLAWLFNISRKRLNDEIANVESTAAPISEKSQGLAMGVTLAVSEKPHRLTLEDVILSKYKYPGSFPIVSERPKAVAVKIRTSQGVGTKAQVEEKPKPTKTETIDPTLDFTTLLIAKPLPFEFDLTPRDKRRESIVRHIYAEGVAHGNYRENREYWGPNQGRDQPLGWGKV